MSGSTSFFPNKKETVLQNLFPNRFAALENGMMMVMIMWMSVGLGKVSETI
jgi:hypothetical protein